jgi:hypothetical protein
MYATLIALLLSAYLAYTGIQTDQTTSFIFAALASGLFLAIAFLVLALSYSPFQKEEQNLTPKLMQILANDRKLKLLLILSAILPVSFLGSTFFPWHTASFLILFGISIDTLFSLYRRIAAYLNPFHIVEFILEDAKSAIIHDQDAKLCELMETATEIANKSIQRHSSALAKEAIEAMEKMGELFLASEASIFHPPQNLELKAQGIPDTISYVFLFLLQHLEDIHRNAMDKRMDLVASFIITIYTKLATYTAGIDLSLTSLPLHYIHKTALQSLQKGSLDIGIKATLGILQIAKAIAAAKDAAYQDIKPPFFTMISTLREISLEIFKKDKTTKIPLLVHPFTELRRLFLEEPLKSHQDAGAIIGQIDLILGEFKALEEVMAMKPPLPKLTIEEETREARQSSN